MRRDADMLAGRLVPDTRLPVPQKPTEITPIHYCGASGPPPGIHRSAAAFLRYTKSWTFARYSSMRGIGCGTVDGHGSRAAMVAASLIDRRGLKSNQRVSSPARSLLVIAAVALSGCATVHTRYSTVYCVTPDQYAKLKQAEPPKVGDKLTGNAQDDLKTIAGSAVRLRTFSDGLLGVIGSCVDPTTEAPAK